MGQVPRTGSPAYSLFLGVVVGMVLAGLVVPLGFGESGEPASVNAGGSSATGSAGASASNSGSASSATGDDGAAGDAAARQSGPESAAAGASAATASATAGPAGTKNAAGRSATAGTPVNTASDQGVTPDAIKVGFLLLDLGSTGRIGVNTTGVDPKQQQAAIEAYVADINEHGGINGRLIKPEFRDFDVLDPDDQRAACIEMTEQRKVFAVVAMPGYAQAAVLCVTEEHATPLFVTGQSVSREFVNRSAGRLVTLQQVGDRMMQNWVVELDGARQLKGRTLGILASEEESSRETVDGTLVPELEAAGHKVAHVSRMSRDQATANSQVPTEIQQMRTKGVDTVLIVQSFLIATPFVQAADRQQWHPRWLVSEFVGMTSDFEVQSMPDSFKGAVAMTAQRFVEWRDGKPEPPNDARCRELYEQATGEQLPRNNGDQSNGAYPTTLYACGLTRVFEAGAKATGAMLTRDGLTAAIQSLGPVDSAFYFPGSFGPNKTDLVDMVRFNRYVAACRCWRNLDEPRAVRYR